MRGVGQMGQFISDIESQLGMEFRKRYIKEMREDANCIIINKHDVKNLMVKTEVNVLVEICRKHGVFDDLVRDYASFANS